MEVIDIASEKSRVEMSRDELLILNAALNEICNGIAVPEFETRVGASKQEVSSLLVAFNQLLDRMGTLD